MAKRKSKPSSSRRNQQQHIKERYSKAREDAQLVGLIETTPEGAIRPEQVNPATQSDNPQPKIVQEAIRNGWAVPESKKPIIVDEMLKILEDPNLPVKIKVAAFNALRMADQQQYERDYPELVARLKGSSGTQVNVNQTTSTTVQVGEVFADISKIEERVAIITNEVYTEADSDLRADNNAESLDEEESDTPKEEPETDRLLDAD